VAVPWKSVDSIATPEGLLELRQRGDKDFLITIGPCVLMNSSANRSEVALGRLACSHLMHRDAPRVLVGGLGMGYTLRAVLDSLPETGRVVVAELNPVVPGWCRGPLAELTSHAVDDPRVTIEIINVADLVRKSSRASGAEGFDAVVFDLYTGPDAHSHKRNDPLYGSIAINNVRAALKPQGVFAVWGENFDEGFSQRLQSSGFSVTTERPGRGGLRHVVYVARMTKAKKEASKSGR
jgi:spermidine synthase